MRNYHDIDVLLPAQKFAIDFSFSSKKPLEFMHSMILRVLRLGACGVVDLANFLNLNQKEATVVLNDLLAKKDIKQTENGLFELTETAKRYFQSVSDIPQIEQISYRTVKITYDMIAFDPILNPEYSNINGLQIDANQELISASEKNAKNTFQNNFYNYTKQDVLTFNQDHPQLYKVEKVTKERQVFNRVNLGLKINFQDKQPLVDNHIFESSFNHLPSNPQAVFEAVKLSLTESKVDNIESIQEELAHNPIFETFTFYDFFMQDELNLKYLGNLKGYQFYGPIYEPDNQKKFLELLERCAEEYSQDVYWLAPSDHFFGKSTNFKILINQLIVSPKYNLKMFLPSRSLKSALWDNRDLIDRSQLNGAQFFALDEEEAFSGDFEVLVVKNKFCIVIAHVRDSNSAVLTTVPIGEFTYHFKLVNSFFEMFSHYEKHMGEHGPCYGVISISK
ncbi:hypothetical protein [Acinetobacter calcoaceticus]|uniref:hypothetical protein n=1 Tax=Acinetobacter calcoaceticus TaxID=471 RepID=UPI002858E804|nr:hypothetical protein [Acinetobacter calcoaceticus]MDR6798318.1 putative transcriptional regulator [Acinetobacter calcoaceticus]